MIFKYRSASIYTTPSVLEDYLQQAQYWEQLDTNHIPNLHVCY